MICRNLFLLATSTIVVMLAAIKIGKIDTNLIMMRFFRDVARSNARKRLYGNEHALMPMLLGKEEPIPIKSADDMNAEGLLTLTHEELSTYNGMDGAPLYLGINGRVYDVSAKPNFYGPDAQYYPFVGKEATRAFATGCLLEECLVSSTEGLNEKEFREIDRWVELYETHDQYTFVGFLVDDPVDAILESDLSETEDVEDI